MKAALNTCLIVLGVLIIAFFVGVGSGTIHS